MASNGTYGMPNANNMTVTTKLLSCDNTTLDINSTIYDLRNLYQNNITSNVFWNVSIINFNCTSGMANYFQQIITFTQAVSIRIQILFASIYFDYINANNYQLNGFLIDPEQYFNLSSISVNNSDTSNACSSGDAAQDPLCRINFTNSVCTVLSNPWTFTCSQQLVTSTTSLFESTSSLETVVISVGLNSWKLGLICGFSVLFVLLLILISGYIYRRYRHSKSLALSNVNIYDDGKSMQKTGIPQGQAFQRATTVVQPKLSNHTATSWIHDGSATNIAQNDENYINLKPPGPYNQVTFVDHAKVYDPGFSQEPMPSVNIPSSPTHKIIGPTVISRPVSGTSINQLKLRTDGLQEDKLNESDNISIDQSILNNPKNPSTPVSRQFTTVSFADENLTDEDAWMSILEVVNVELAKLNEEETTKTLL